jgi:hypothetical protein
MLALVAYPVAFEPWLRTHSQLIGWSAGYGLFVVLCGATALLKSGWKSAPVVTVAGSAEEVSPPEFRQKLLWMALAACASTLLLAVTNHLTQDVAPIPFLWVVPLALYLLTFIICFDRPRWYKRNAFLILMALSLWGMVQSIFQQVDLRVAIPVFSLGLFFCCMFCHGELARMRPHAQYLTAFYLMLSLGGALGGLFVGLAAPHLFPAYFELPIAMTGCAILATIIQKDNHRQYWLWLSAASVLVGISIVDVRRETKGARIVARNFYGAVRVVDEGEGEEAVRKLYHGVINHGAQYLADDKRDRATTYYARASGVGQAIQSTRRSTQRVGIVGLGTGTIAVYGQPGDHYRFYEINPLVVRLARTEFTFLRDSKAQVDIVLGDGRISLEQEPPQQFDILAVDAFSGDSIPVHLLTSEAFGLYFRHLKSDGVLALHLSNRYLELKTVAKQLADAFHKQALLIDTDDDEDDDEIFGATWVLIGSTKANEALERQATPIFVNRRTRLWTDDYSNLFQVLK